MYHWCMIEKRYLDDCELHNTNCEMCELEDDCYSMSEEEIRIRWEGIY
jgi:hypothetical protein